MSFFYFSYPLILSIENHCSIPQQQQMARIMKDIFGKKLYMDEVDTTSTTLPSPEALKMKILVKVRLFILNFFSQKWGRGNRVIRITLQELHFLVGSHISVWIGINDHSYNQSLTHVWIKNIKVSTRNYVLLHESCDIC